MEDVSRWTRSPRTGSASRSDGVTLALLSGAWTCRFGESSTRLKTPGLLAFLDRAIEEADELHTPEGWTYEAGIWKTDKGWWVRPVESGWGVFRTVRAQEERASRKTFESSDRARRWAELRFERGEAPLRGPKARAGERAMSKLPDVRVTEEERIFAEEILGSLDLSYSEFVRAALRWASNNLLNKAATWRAERGADGVRFTPKDTP